MTTTRRDFVSGFAMALAALGMTPLEAVAQGLLDPLAIGPASPCRKLLFRTECASRL